jgi:hypothetical protein
VLVRSVGIPIVVVFSACRVDGFVCTVLVSWAKVVVIVGISRCVAVLVSGTSCRLVVIIGFDVVVGRRVGGGGFVVPLPGSRYNAQTYGFLIKQSSDRHNPSFNCIPKHLFSLELFGWSENYLIR